MLVYVLMCGINEALSKIKLIETNVLVNLDGIPGSLGILVVMINTHNDYLYRSHM